MNLHYIGSNEHLTKYKCNSSVEELCSWYRTLKEVQFDTETNVCSSIVDRKLKVLQFGDTLGAHKYPREVYVVQWSFLPDEDKEKVRELLRDISVLKIIHNTAFDAQVMLNEDVILDNTWDTFVQEEDIYSGYDYKWDFFALAATLLRRYFVDISKEQQGNFGDDIINDEKLEYAATDVIHLGRLAHDQRTTMVSEDIIQLSNGEYNENEAALAFADIEYNGMGFDPIGWDANIGKAEPIIRDATLELNKILLTEPYKSLGHKSICNVELESEDGTVRKLKMPYILDKDILAVNWNSPSQLVRLLNYIFPDLKSGAQLGLKTYLKECDPAAPKNITVTSKEFSAYINVFDATMYTVLKLVLLKKFEYVEKALVLNFRDKLITDKYLLPENTVNINWNSPKVKLEVFKWFNPKCENTDADTVDDNILIPFFKYYKRYGNANSLLQKYGAKFALEQVDSDGRVRTRFDTVLSTGRVSSSKPNCQNIPAKSLPKGRKNDYRNCFIPGYEGWSVVGADYAS